MSSIEVTASGAIQLAKAESLASEFKQFLDFKNMLCGSIQVLWKNQTDNTGLFEILVSNVPGEIEDNFVPFNATKQVNTTCKGHMFNFANSFIGFRFALLKYTPNGETTGTFDVWGVGKRHGGMP